MNGWIIQLEDYECPYRIEIDPYYFQCSCTQKDCNQATCPKGIK